MKLVAVFGWKYEPEWLIDDLKENLSSWVDDFAIVDCRDRTDELWINEAEYRLLQRQACFEKEADWVLVTSADERWEDRAGEVIRPMIEKNKRDTVYKFPLREMWSPTEYRVDKLWGRKMRSRLYPLIEGQLMSQRPIQAGPIPIRPALRPHVLDVNIYHLKMIEPENRVERAYVFEALDPNYEMQIRDPKKLTRLRRDLDPENVLIEHGYHYLYNEDGLKLKPIPAGREFSPPYTKPYVFEVPPHFLQQ